MLREAVAAFREYYYITLVFAVFLVAAVLVWIKAVSAARKRGKQRGDILEKLREEDELRAEFSSLTDKKASSADSERLIRGAALNVGRELEQSGDINSAFEKLAKQKQFIYALSFVFFEDAESLSDFYRKNGSPLTETADDAARHIIGGNFYDTFHKGFRMFDGGDEDYSATSDEVKALDEEYFALLKQEKEEIFCSIKKYICEDIEIFNNKEMC